ncbi:MAG: ParB/RepB/Spo0J family partition protein, partial [Spirochaetales bacterium]
TQDELAKRLGKSRPALANSLRLLKLNDDELDALAAGRLTPGHARALLHIRDENKRRSLLEQIVADKLSVRAAEYVAAGREIPPEEFTQQDLPNDAAPSERTPAPETAGKTEPREDTNVTAGEGALKSPELQQIEDKLIGHIGGRVVIRGSDNRGKIEITYLSTEDLERILEVIGLKL